MNDNDKQELYLNIITQAKEYFITNHPFTLAYHNAEHTFGMVDNIYLYIRKNHILSDTNTIIEISSKEGLMLLVAIYFHDIVYVPGNTDNEDQSIMVFNKWFDRNRLELDPDGIFLDEEFNAVVGMLIKSTQVFVSDEDIIKSYDNYGLFNKYCHLVGAIHDLDFMGFTDNDTFLENERKLHLESGLPRKEFEPKYRGFLEALLKFYKHRPMFSGVLLGESAINKAKKNIKDYLGISDEESKTQATENAC